MCYLSQELSARVFDVRVSVFDACWRGRAQQRRSFWLCDFLLCLRRLVPILGGLVGRLGSGRCLNGHWDSGPRCAEDGLRTFCVVIAVCGLGGSCENGEAEAVIRV
jgi:hypothetical protein